MANDDGELVAHNTFFQSQNPHGVQRIDQGQAQTEPLAEGLGEWLKLVVTPGVILVAFPGVPEGVSHGLQPGQRSRRHCKHMKSESRFRKKRKVRR